MLSYFSNRENSVFDKMGFKTDQNGILKRYLNETEAWAPHLKKTKETILHHALLKAKTKVAILGSGWLFDIPLPELTSIFKEVWLFDVHHPRQVKQQVSKFGNVKLIETDLSGFAIPIYTLGHQKKLNDDDLKDLHPSFSFSLSEFDFVVSCNLLNQLDIILLDYLLERTMCSDTLETDLRRLIQQTHLNLLPANKSCIITDIEELWVNKKDEIIGKKQLIYTDFQKYTIDDAWIWQFDNHFNYHDHCKTWLKVVVSQI
jgi:hypothetical protein